MARGSLWTRLRAAEARLSHSDPNGEIIGILRRIVDVDALDKIGGLHYRAVEGFSHPLDGQSIEFDPPIDAYDVPSPWRELLVDKTTGLPARAD